MMLFMSINNNKQFIRELSLKKQNLSAFLFGPRMTGKTSLLKLVHPVEAYYNLLDPELEIRLRGNPKEFWEEIAQFKRGDLIIIDEVQRLPVLLDYVQMAMDELNLRFYLSGSSARKLKRGGANLLGGRALDLKLHPLTVQELKDDFSLKNALQFGTLPRVSQILSTSNRSAQQLKREGMLLLKSYVTTYIKEEIQAEALVRKLDSFQRFLNVAAQSNGQMIEMANISRECSVPQNTVKEYYSILEDTLIGRMVWPFDRSERKKARPKFYFFDCGVLRALQNRVSEAPSPAEKGNLFETWFINELFRILDYTEKEHRISLWRLGKWEIDILIESSTGPLLAIECKTGKQLKRPHAIKAFRKTFPKVPLFIASLLDTRPRKLADQITIYPYLEVLKMYRDGADALK